MKTLENWQPIARETPAEDLPAAATKILAQADGNTAVAEIARRTGLPVEDVLVAMGDLVRRGALDAADAPHEVVQLAHVHARAPSVAPAPRAHDVARDDAPDDVMPPEHEVESLPELEVVGIPTDEDLAELPELELVDAGPAEERTAGGGRIEVSSANDEEQADEGLSNLDGDASAMGDAGDAGDASDAYDAGDAGDASSLPGEQAAAMGSFRQVFETTLRPLPVEVRVEWAHTGSGDVLCALCMDPTPGVIEAILKNPNANLEHARLIAEHHRNPIGLDAVGKRAEYLRDSTVRRLLLRNQQASERLLTRMLGGLPLTQVFRSNVGHELTERARRAGRTVLRRKFDQAQADEKVGLIVQTEGRCLANLVGLTFDQKTVALLCRRTYPSTMLIQSLARFPATPPTLIAHLLRQQGVVRNAHLKKRLQQHPNCPKHLKR